MAAHQLEKLPLKLVLDKAHRPDEKGSPSAQRSPTMDCKIHILGYDHPLWSSTNEQKEAGISRLPSVLLTHGTHSSTTGHYILVFAAVQTPGLGITASKGHQLVVSTFLKNFAALPHDVDSI